MNACVVTSDFYYHRNNSILEDYWKFVLQLQRYVLKNEKKIKDTSYKNTDNIP